MGDTELVITHDCSTRPKTTAIIEMQSIYCKRIFRERGFIFW